MRYQNILFDLDGTLTDPSEGITKCYHYALQQLGETEIPDTAIHRLIGPPLRVGFGALLRDTSQERIEEAVRLYRERFATVGIYEVALNRDVVSTLTRLRSLGKTLFVVTSKTESFANETLRYLGIDHFFDGVFGGDLAGTLDDKADIVAKCVETTGIDPADSVMIGDRLYDFHAAISHGIPMIGVRCGFAGPGELESLGCLRIIEDLGELLLPAPSTM